MTDSKNPRLMPANVAALLEEEQCGMVELATCFVDLREWKKERLEGCSMVEEIFLRRRISAGTFKEKLSTLLARAGRYTSKADAASVWIAGKNAEGHKWSVERGDVVRVQDTDSGEDPTVVITRENERLISSMPYETFCTRWGIDFDAS